MNLYTYSRQNPVKYLDPDGNAAETAWDVFSIAIGTTSLINNVREGNWLAAATDAVGVALDAVATAVPGVPGGVGVIIQSVRRAEGIPDAAKTVEKTVDAAKGTGKEGGSAPDFVVTLQGEAIQIPKGAAGPTPVVNPQGRTTGFGYTGGSGGLGMDPKVSDVRIMDPTPPRGLSPGYPGGYVSYESFMN